MPRSDTIERLPDGFWDAVAQPARATPRADAGARAETAHESRTGEEPRRGQAPSARREPTDRVEGPEPRVGRASGAERLQAIFNGRVIAIEPHHAPDDASDEAPQDALAGAPDDDLASIASIGSTLSRAAPGYDQPGALKP